MRFVTNYTQGWSGRDLDYEDFVKQVTKEGHRLTYSEHYTLDSMVKPFVDIDLETKKGDFRKEDYEKVKEDTLHDWVLLLRPLCGADKLAYAERCIPDLGNGEAKISYHFHLNGLKCRAGSLKDFFTQKGFAGKPGFDMAPYIKGGDRVWCCVGCYKPKRGGAGTQRMEPMKPSNCLHMHLMHYHDEHDLKAAKDVTPKGSSAPATAAKVLTKKRKQPEKSTAAAAAAAPARGDPKPPPHIMEYVNFYYERFLTGTITFHADRDETVTRKYGRKEVQETELRNVWYVQCAGDGRKCPVSHAHGQDVEHGNHAYIDIFVSFKSPEDKARNVGGEVVLVQVRCMHDGNTFPDCCNTVDVTKEAKDWRKSVLQCKEWNERIRFIESTSSFYYTVPGKPPVPVKEAGKAQNIMANKSRMKIHEWLQHPMRLQFHEVDFYPSLDPEQLPRRFVDGTDMNLFRGYAIRRETARAGDVQPLLDHIKNIWCCGDEASYEYVLNWMAQILQTPWKRTRVVLVLISKEGTGKGMVITDIFGEILGDQCFLSESRKDNVFGQFNSALSCKTVVVLNELLWAGSHEAAGVFKDMITDKRITINEKHQVQRPETCYQNYMICTQGQWAVPASCEARRFFVVEPDEKYAGNQTDESVAYFDSVASVTPEHFAHFLYNRDISRFKSTIVPETKALTKQKEQSLMPVQSALLECLQRGLLPGSVGSDDTTPTFGQSFGDGIARNSMQDDWTTNFKTQHGWPNTPQKFWQALMQATQCKGVSILIDEGRRMECGDRQHWMRFKPLQECRDWWDTFMFVPSNGWPSVEDPVDHRKLHEENQNKRDALAAEMQSIDRKMKDLSKQYHLLKSQKRNSECEQLLQEIQLLESKLRDLRTKLDRI